MPRYAVSVLDYAAAQRAEKQAAKLLEQLSETLKDAVALKKRFERGSADVASLNDAIEELINGEVLVANIEPALAEFDVSDLDDQVDGLRSAVETCEASLRQLSSLTEQAEAWEKHFRKAWQALFLARFGEAITKEQADDSFYDAAGDGQHWIDERGELRIDLEKIFENQDLFDPADYDEEV